MLATLRTTNISPGEASKIVAGSTRLSEQAITMTFGDCASAKVAHRARWRDQPSARKRWWPSTRAAKSIIDSQSSMAPRAIRGRVTRSRCSFPSGERQGADIAMTRNGRQAQAAAIRISERGAC
jgi:hypothetical protein